MRRKKLEKKIGTDADAVRNDLRQLRDDLANIVRSRRRRGSEEVHAGAARVREVVTEVRERPARRGEYPEQSGRWHRVSAVRKYATRKRGLAAAVALGAAAYLLLRRREAVGIESAAPRRGWRARLPWAARSQGTGVQPEPYESPVGITPPESSEVTVMREEASIGNPEKVTSF